MYYIRCWGLAVCVTHFQDKLNKYFRYVQCNKIYYIFKIKTKSYDLKLGAELNKLGLESHASRRKVSLKFKGNCHYFRECSNSKQL